MQRDKIRYTHVADMDMLDIYENMANGTRMADSATRYYERIVEKIEALRDIGMLYEISPYQYVQNHYGPNARTTTCKRYTIIYNMEGDMVIIRRIIAGSLIT
jgi:hypothetical protein